MNLVRAGKKIISFDLHLQQRSPEGNYTVHKSFSYLIYTELVPNVNEKIDGEEKHFDSLDTMRHRSI